MSRNPIRVGDIEFQVSVQPLRGGGFTYTIIQLDQSGSDVIENRYDSALHFETENEAYDGGFLDAQRRASKTGG